MFSTPGSAQSVFSSGIPSSSTKKSPLKGSKGSNMFDEIAHKQEIRSFLDTQVYREMIEEALTESLSTIKKERTEAAHRLKTIRSRLEVAETNLGQARHSAIEDSEKARENLNTVRKEHEEERVRWRMKNAELEGRWRESQEMLQRSDAALRTAESERVLERQESLKKSEELQKSMSGVQHLLSHVEKDAATLRRQLEEAVAAREEAERMAGEARASFAKYQQVVGDAIEAGREQEAKHETKRLRKHSSVCGRSADLRHELEVRHLLQNKVPEHGGPESISEEAQGEEGVLAKEEEAQSKKGHKIRDALFKIVQSHPK